MATRLWLPLLCLLFAATARATDWYVSPTGSAAGTGAMGSEWDLQTALNQPAGVMPGDDIWVEGGTYASSAGYTSNLNGSATAQITVRNYQGQRATLDGAGSAMVLYLGGSYSTFWGLEVIDSTTTRVSSSTASTNAPGVGIYGPFIQCINLIVHDTNQGFSGYNASPDAVVYGNLSYYNGYVGTDRNHGHGYYMQNLNGLKVVQDNFSGDNADEGFQIYGSGSADVEGFRMFGNVAYNNSSWPTPAYQYNYIVAGGGVRENIQFVNNFSYFTIGSGQGYVALGDYTDGNDMLVMNNVFAGGYLPLTVNDQAGPFTFTNNVLYADDAGTFQVDLELDTGQTLATYDWDDNTYYGPVTLFRYSGPNESGFPVWQSATGLDTHSTFSGANPTGVWTYVQPNLYEGKRANVIIYNWDLDATVQVDLSSVLNIGDGFVIQDAQNFFGPAVVSGTYSGPVDIPMTGLAKATPIGFTTPAHTAPYFGTFIVLPSGGCAPNCPGAGGIVLDGGNGDYMGAVATGGSSGSVSTIAGGTGSGTAVASSSGSSASVTAAAASSTAAAASSGAASSAGTTAGGASHGTAAAGAAGTTSGTGGDGGVSKGNLGGCGCTAAGGLESSAWGLLLVALTWRSRRNHRR